MGSSAGLILAASFAIAQMGSAQFVPLPPVEQASAPDASERAKAGDLDKPYAVTQDAATPADNVIQGPVVLPGQVMEGADAVVGNIFEGADELPGTCLSASWLASGGKDGFGSVDMEANHAWLFGYDDWPPLTISPGVGMHLWSGPAGIDLPSRVYDVYLDLAWRPIETEHWGLSVGVIPGWYGDFEIFDGRTFQLTGWILGNYRFNACWNIVSGVAYVRQLKNHLLPVGGIVWTPTDDTRLEFLVPKPKIARRIMHTEAGSTWCYVAGELGGGTWAVADSTDENVSVTYTDLRVVLGVELFRCGGLQCSFEAGYVFARDISVDDVVIDSPDNTFLLQASVAF